MPVISISELGYQVQGFIKEYDVEIKHDMGRRRHVTDDNLGHETLPPGQTTTATIIDPLYDSTRRPGLIDANELRWFIEEYAEKQPFESSRSREAALLWQTYVARLQTTLLPHLHLERLAAKSDLYIEIDGSDDPGSGFYAIHWEVLERSELWKKYSNVRQVAVVRLVRGPHVCIDPSPAIWKINDRGVRSFKILLVTARLQHLGDIPDRLISRTIRRVLSEDITGDCEPSVEIVRPGTYDQFLLCLSNHEPGYFDLVHFDLHGGVDEDQHNAYLLFMKLEDITGIVPHRIPAVDIALHLVRHGVQHVVLNSCESAKEGFHSGTNAARLFIKYGLAHATAMSFKALSTSMEIFVKAFYKQLINNSATFLSATHAGREALRYSLERNTKFGTTVDIDDSIIPVLYQRSIVLQTESGLYRYSPSQPVESLEQTEIFGREEDVTRIELRLLSGHSCALLVGPAGIGKTSLAAHLSLWWEETGLIAKTAYIDCEGMMTVDPEVLGATLCSALLPVESRLDLPALTSFIHSHPCLLIFDNLETLVQPSRRPGERSAMDVRRFFKKLLTAARGKSMFVFISRRDEPWLFAIFGDAIFCHELDGLVPLSAAMRYSVSVLQSTAFPPSLDPADIEYLERICKVAQRNPLVINSLMKNMMRHGDRPKQYYHRILYGSSDLMFEENAETRAISQLSDLLIRQVAADGVADMTRVFSGTAQGLRAFVPLLGLMRFWDVLPFDELPIFGLLFQVQVQKYRSISLNESRKCLTGFETLIVSGLANDLFTDPTIKDSLDSASDQLNASLMPLLESGFLSAEPPGTLSQQRRSLRIHPLVPLLLRHHAAYMCFMGELLLPIRKIYDAAFIRFHAYRMSRWPLRYQYWNSQLQDTVAILNREFINFFVAANLVIKEDIRASPPDEWPSQIYSLCMLTSQISRSIRTDHGRHSLLAELWFKALMACLAVIQDFQQRPSFSAPDDPMELRLTAYSVQLFATLFATLLQTYYEDIDWSFANRVRRMIKKLPSIPLAKSGNNDATRDEAITELQRITTYMSAMMDWQSGSAKKGMDAMMTARHQFVEGSIQRSGHLETLPSDFNDFRKLATRNSTSALILPLWDAMEAVYQRPEGVDSAKARALVEATLLSEINERSNFAGNKAELYKLLAKVSEEQGDTQQASEHRKRAQALREEARTTHGMETAREEARTTHGRESREPERWKPFAWVTTGLWNLEGFF